MIKVSKFIAKLCEAIMGKNIEDDIYALFTENGLKKSTKTLNKNSDKILEALNNFQYPEAKIPKWLRDSSACFTLCEGICDLEHIKDTCKLTETQKDDIHDIFDLLVSGDEVTALLENLIEDTAKSLGKKIGANILTQECFAYVPDICKPESWDVQILDESGSFIETNIAQILPTLAEEHIAKTKSRYIEAKLKHSKASGERAIYENFTLLNEAHAKKLSQGRLSITVISPGLTRDGLKFYPSSVLAEAVHLYDGAKMFMNHATDNETWERPERDVNAWTGVLENARLGPNGEILADAIIIDPVFKEKIELLDSQGKLDKLGISHSVVGSGDIEEIDDTLVMRVTDIFNVLSVDFVTEGNAGNEIHMLEAFSNDLSLATIKQLEESRPDLIAQIKTNLTENSEEKSMNWEKIATELKEEIASLKEANVGNLKELQEKLDEALKAISENAENEKLVEAQAKIKSEIDESKLPDEAKEMLTESFKESVSFEDVTESLTNQIKVMQGLQEAPKIEGLGREEPKKDKQTIDEGKTALIGSYKARYLKEGYSDEDAKRMASKMYADTH